ncbi:MAG: tetraacyldisaccharide 4'-kinase [Endomicrobiales bacterium]
MTRLLYPFSLAYAALLAADRMRTRPRRLQKPVISVGNITWGGTGKTPVVIRLSKDLLARGLKPAVLSRGYRRKGGAGAPLLVSDGVTLLAGAREAGDEPCLIAGSVPGALVLSGPDRHASAQAALAKGRPDVFVLDDGFQHWKLERELDIVCVNAADSFGNGLLIPAGILREPLSALKRAGIIILVNADSLDASGLERLEKEISRHSAAPVLRARYRPSALASLRTGSRVPPETLKGKQVLALSAIAGNSGFLRFLGKCGFSVENALDFRDHHWYNIKEVVSFISRSAQNHPVVTTAKDAVKLKELLPLLGREEADRFFVLEVELDFTTGEKTWQEQVQKVLQSS